MLLWDTVEFAHVTLGLVPQVLNAIDVIMAISEKLGMVVPKVVKVRHILQLYQPQESLTDMYPISHTD